MLVITSSNLSFSWNLKTIVPIESFAAEKKLI